jgi:hypothetical protein
VSGSDLFEDFLGLRDLEYHGGLSAIGYFETTRLRLVTVELISSDPAMVQAVSCQPLTAAVRVRAQVSPCDICGGQSVTGTVFSPSSSVFICQYYFTVAVHT